MEQEKILLQIESELVALRTFIRKLKPEARLHQLDIDLIKQKARSMYDSVLMLEPTPAATPKATVFDIKKPEPAEVPEEELDNSMELEKERLKKNVVAVEAETLMTSEKEIVHEEQKPAKQEPEVVVSEKPEPEPKPEQKPEPEPEIEKEPEIVVKEKKPATIEFEIEEPVAEPEVKPIANKPEEPAEQKAQPQVDLFSTSPETVADKLSSSGQQTLADRLSQSNNKSLRQFIGINEKFLFINELFNGDMSRYNSAIDELDSMPTLKGADTFLFELKVQNLWDDDLDAYLKLKELLTLKFG